MDTRSKVRKVIKFNNCKAIILPKEFCDRVGINYGDTVVVAYKDIAVIVKPSLKEDKALGERNAV